MKERKCQLIHLERRSCENSPRRRPIPAVSISFTIGVGVGESKNSDIEVSAVPIVAALNRTIGNFFMAAGGVAAAGLEKVSVGVNGKLRGNLQRPLLCVPHFTAWS